ncbi:MAG: NAD(+) diphosphatase [Solirubrobacterales bacterium]|nr:NAD(+) diphosphatase [Solirubrobacterales bacterium]
MPRPFTGMALDRASAERKDPAEIERLLLDPQARALVAADGGVLVADGASPALLRVPLVVRSWSEPILLGLDSGGEPVFAVDLDSLAPGMRAQITDGARLTSLREAGTQLPRAEAGLAAYMAALLNWHRRHRFCSTCGTNTVIEEAGHSRRCPRCGAHHFPRTDPVVIMTVEHERRLLLGRRAGWPAGRCSVLAGFISPGESAEEAVIREVREESGIIAREPCYVTSQPWPFPSSLMLGFDAVSDGGDPAPADDELDEVGWFSLDAVCDAVAERNPVLQLPPPVSIARFLIERWVARKQAGGS